MLSFYQSMRRFRLPLLIAVAAGGLLVLALAIAFSSGFQTWAARRALASHPELTGTIGRVSAGLGRVEARDVRLERDGAVLTLPRVEADVSLLGAMLRDKLTISRLVARGWTLDLTQAGVAGQTAPALDGRSRGPAAPAAAGVATPPAAHPRAHSGGGAAEPDSLGIFSELELPMDTAVHGVELEGSVLLPEGRGRVRVTLRGGGLLTGNEGQFRVTADATLADPAVSTLSVRGTVLAVMDTPRTFVRLAAGFDASAKGREFPEGVALTAQAAAVRTEAGEDYSAAVVNGERPLVAVQAGFPRGAEALDGTWKIDLSDRDVAPFLLGYPLPAFAASGEGRFHANTTFEKVRAAGRIDATAERLGTVAPLLSAIDRLEITTDFDLSRNGGVIGIDQLGARLSDGRPVAEVHLLQPFAFDVESREFHAADPAGELVRMRLQDVPLAWANPLLDGYSVAGGTLVGELVAIVQAGAIRLRTQSPLVAQQTSLSTGERPLLQDVDVSLNGLAEYGPEGWQADVLELTGVNQGVTVFGLSGKAGQLAGVDQPVKTTGRLAADLPAVLAQPAASNALAVSRGTLAVDFIASLASRKELQARIALDGLAAPGGDGEQTLPRVSADIRADVVAGGLVTWNAPLLFERDGRKSDVTVAGTMEMGNDRRVLQAQLTSEHLIVDDAKALTAVLPPVPPAPAATERGAAPLWAGTTGAVSIHLRKLVYSEIFEITEVAGTLRLEEGAVRLETVRAGIGDMGVARLAGVLTFDPAAALPYGLGAELEVTEFDPGPLLRAIRPEQPPTVEGRFDVNSTLTSRADSIGALAVGAGGEFELTSRGGVFRGVPLTVGDAVDNTSRVAGLISSAGSAIGALTGRRQYPEIANKAQAALELGRSLNPIAYDQLSVVLARDAALNTTLREFTLISPETRLTGRGHALHRPGASLLDDALSMEFTLRARGRQGELLKYLGVLDAATDDLGYAMCTVPITINGTIGKPDATELSSRVASLAIEKSGLADRAGELINRMRSGSPQPGGK
jgi:hypothetical protein